MRWIPILSLSGHCRRIFPGRDPLLHGSSTNQMTIRLSQAYSSKCSNTGPFYEANPHRGLHCFAVPSLHYGQSSIEMRIQTRVHPAAASEPFALFTSPITGYAKDNCPMVPDIRPRHPCFCRRALQLCLPRRDSLPHFVILALQITLIVTGS